jgi:5-(carboxyamino)imidazole ribonucleotide synthase
MTKSGTTIGIIGAGQLARMLIEAAIPLDLDLRLLAASSDDGAARIWPATEIGSPDDPDAVARFAETCDVVTFDHELVPEPVLVRLEAGAARLAPSASTLRIAQNKQRQRELFAQHELPQPRHRVVRTAVGAQLAAETIGYPVAVKAAYGGYDGRGVWICLSEAGLMAVVAGLEQRAIPIIVEAKVDMDREIAVMVARDDAGRTTVYPAVETVQIEGICRQISFDVEHGNEEAANLARCAADVVGLTGVMAIELFESGSELLINEIATRPHNSGHHTIEAVATSQFEQHLRAILNLAPGSIEPRTRAAVTVNVLGGSDGMDPRERLALLESGDVHVHLYGKAARHGRKLGHVTVFGADVDECAERAWRAVETLTNEQRPEQLR